MIQNFCSGLMDCKKCIQITSDLQINASQSLHYHKPPAVGWQE